MRRLSYDVGMPAGRQNSMMDLRQFEDERKNKRYSMAVGPYDDLPPHLRNYLVRNKDYSSTPLLFIALFSERWWASSQCKNYSLSRPATQIRAPAEYRGAKGAATQKRFSSHTPNGCWGNSHPPRACGTPTLWVTQPNNYAFEPGRLLTLFARNAKIRNAFSLSKKHQ